MFKNVIMFAAVAGLVLGLTSLARGEFTNWHDKEHGPVTTGNIWSHDANWTNGTPEAGDGFRIEQYDTATFPDATGTGTIIMDVDYSAGGVSQAQFFGAETVSMENYFKATGNGVWLVNGGNGPAGTTVLVSPTGTIDGNVTINSNPIRQPPTIDFAGGDWVAGNLRYNN